MTAFRIRLTLVPLTPVAMGGAAPDARAEIRAASFKGLLRWWYRAVDPAFATHEPRLFGHVNGNGARSLVQVRAARKFHVNAWERRHYEDAPFVVGTGRNTMNGLKYLAFPWFMPGGDARRWLPVSPTSTHWLDIGFDRALQPEDQQRVLAALWAMVHLGSVGGRSRRGFGSLGCTKVEVTRGTCTDLDALSFVHDAPDVNSYVGRLASGIATIRGWLSGGAAPAHSGSVPALGAGSQVLIRPQGAPEAAHGGIAGWESALKDVGLAFQDFRSRRSPDYQRVKDELNRLAGAAASPPLVVAPERTAFGMPLTFRFTSVRTDPRSMSFTPTTDDSDRWGSPLIIKVTRIGGNVHPMVVRLAAPTPEAGGVLATPSRGAATVVAPPVSTVVDDFCDSLARSRWRRVP